MAAVAAVKAERGSPDVIFANAGTGRPQALSRITGEDIDETFDIHVKGTSLTVM